MLSGLLLSAALSVPGAEPAPIVSQLPSAPPPPAMASSPSADLALPPLPSEEVLYGGGADCGATACLTDRHSGPVHRYWANASYLHYWYKNAPSPLTLLNRTNAAGVVTPVLGRTDADFGAASGLDFNIGMWLNSRHTFGLQLGGFLMEQRSSFAGFASDAAGSPLLTRPITNVVLGQPGTVVVAQPGTIAGGLATASGLRFSGAEGLGVRNLAYCENYHLDLLVGLKYLDLDEYLSITQVSRPVAGGQLFFNGQPLPANQGVTINDRFRTRNQFWGGIIGLQGHYCFGPVFARGSVKVGMGNNHQVVDIDGSSVVSPQNGPNAVHGGLLAVRGGNIGRDVTNRFAIVNELGAQIGVHVTPYARVMVGYDFFYLNNVVRPGQQVDPFVNPRLVPTSASFGGLAGITSPVVTGIRDDFFAHGLRFGLELQY